MLGGVRNDPLGRSDNRESFFFQTRAVASEQVFRRYNSHRSERRTRSFLGRVGGGKHCADCGLLQAFHGHLFLVSRE